MLTTKDIKAIGMALDMIAAGPWDDGSYGKRPDWESIGDRLHDLRGKITIPLSKKQVELLCLGLRAGIGDDGIQNIGLNKREQKQLAAVANRFLDAIGSHLPRYWETDI